MGNDCQTHGVLDCRIWSSGIVALTGDYQFIAVTNFIEPRPRKFPSIPNLISLPSSWIIIEPQFSLSSNVEVYVGIGKTIYSLDASGVQDQVKNQS